MIPEPTADDLARDAEFDYAPWSDIAAKEVIVAVMHTWIRRYVATEKRAVAAERERDELRAEVERLKQREPRWQAFINSYGWEESSE